MEDDEESHHETIVERQTISKPEILFDFQTPHDKRPYHELDQRSLSMQSKLKARKDISSKGIIQTQIDTRTNIENRLVNNDTILQKILNNSVELIQNIRVLNDKELSNQRELEKQNTDELCKILEKEAITTQSKLDAIMDRWNELKSIEDDPIQLPELLEIQKRRISEVVTEKNEVIQQFRNDIKRMDECYSSFADKQFNDSYFMIQRMKSLLECMRKSYQHHIELLVETLDEERDNLFLAGKHQWEELSTKHKENINMKNNIDAEKTAFFDKELEKIKLNHIEMTRSVRIRLEKDYEQSQQDLQTLKAYCLMNCEKFDYNYQILQKKGDENVTIRNQEKRRLAQLRETIQKLKKKIRDSKSKFEVDAKQLTKEIVRLHDAIVELEKKADRDAKTNNDRYEQIWEINTKEVSELLDKVLSIDKVFYEQQLDLEWKQPDLDLLKKHRLKSYINAVKLTNPDIFEKEVPKNLGYSTVNSQKIQNDQNECQTIKIDPNIADNRVVRIILRRLAEQTGFLMEDKLLEILESHGTPDRTLVHVDTVFKALGISHLKDVSTLMDYCLPHMWCPNCKSDNDVQELLQLSRSNYETVECEQEIARWTSNPRIIKFQGDSDSESSTTSTVKYSYQKKGIVINDLTNLDTYSVDSVLASYIEQFSHEAGINRAIQNIHKTPKIEDPIPNKPQCFDHYLVIESAYLLKILQDYVDSYLNQNPYGTPIMTMADRICKVRHTIARLISNEDVEHYWQRFGEIFSKDKQHLWKAMEQGLKCNLKILQKRDKLDAECEFLRVQNSELRYLLSGYTNQHNMMR